MEYGFVVDTISIFFIQVGCRLTKMGRVTYHPFHGAMAGMGAPRRPKRALQIVPSKRCWQLRRSQVRPWLRALEKMLVGFGVAAFRGLSHVAASWPAALHRMAAEVGLAAMVSESGGASRSAGAEAVCCEARDAQFDTKSSRACRRNCSAKV